MNARTLGALSICALLTSTAPALSDDEPERGWKDTAELSLVVAGGNSETSTFSFTNELAYLAEGSTFTFTAEALRAESTTVSRAAFSTQGGIDLVETEQTDVTAERYRLATAYDRHISDRHFWNVGIEGLKNELAGVDLRIVAQGGLGQVWVDREDAHLKTRTALTFTREEDLAGNEDEFAGLRLGADYDRGWGENTTFGGEAVVDVNADETDDLRLDWTNWVSVSMSERLALKLSLKLLYDNLPSTVPAPLFTPDGVETGSVPVELDELDTLFTAALVVRF